MSLSKEIEMLIQTGEQLVPKGGKEIRGYNGQLQPDYVSWRLQTMAVIGELGKTGSPLLKELETDKRGPYFYSSSASRVLGTLKAALALCNRVAPQETIVKQPLSKAQKKSSTAQDTVFIVHGHDKVLLEQTARFIEKLDIRPVILFEAPGRGQTIIEKLESNCAVSFAVVLLTPDDSGKSAKDSGEPRPRARQNVVLELGYFLGKLNRSNVIVIYDESVELPSDYRGVEYIRVDAEGAWKLKLAREMKAAGLSVDMNKAI